MTDRERWTVYPLLFLALGITVKDKLPPRHVDVEEVRCNKLVVADRQHKEQIILGATPRGGLIQVRGERDSGLIALGYVNNLAALMFSDGTGKFRVPPIGWETGAEPQIPAAAQPEPARESTPERSPQNPEPADSDGRASPDKP
jgi:hypothetical protein